MSVLHPEADIIAEGTKVRFGPMADRTMAIQCERRIAKTTRLSLPERYLVLRRRPADAIFFHVLLEQFLHLWKHVVDGWIIAQEADLNCGGYLISFFM